MAKVFRCKDVGVTCGWEARAETEEELLKMIAEHGATEHDIKEITEELKAKVSSAIREE